MPQPPSFRLPLGMAVLLALSGCQVIKGIFDAGVWVGMVGVIVLVIIVGVVLSIFRR